MKDENGVPLDMLNAFVHDIKVTLEQKSVRGDKTNGPGCLTSDLERHLEELFDTYPASGRCEAVRFSKIDSGPLAGRDELTFCEGPLVRQGSSFS